MNKAKPIPTGFHTLTPNLVVRDTIKAIEFYKKAFGAEVLYPPMAGPDGKVMHAEVKIGDSILMLNDEMEPMPNCPAVKSPLSAGCNTATMLLYVKDCDAAFQQAKKAGCQIVQEPIDMFWGDRWATVVDPFGAIWSVATHIEDVSRSDMEKRAKEFYAQMG